MVYVKLDTLTSICLDQVNHSWLLVCSKTMKSRGFVGLVWLTRIVSVAWLIQSQGNNHSVPINPGRSWPKNVNIFDATIGERDNTTIPWSKCPGVFSAVNRIEWCHFDTIVQRVHSVSWMYSQAQSLTFSYSVMTWPLVCSHMVCLASPAN